MERRASSCGLDVDEPAGLYMNQVRMNTHVCARFSKNQNPTDDVTRDDTHQSLYTKES